MQTFVLPAALRAEIRAFLKLAIPLASAQLAQAMTGFVDTIMMGWLGQVSLAAGGLAVMVFMSVLMTGSGILSGVSPLVAAAYGAQQSHQVGRILQQGLWLALFLLLPILPLMGHFGTVMHGLGQDPIVIDLANEYLQVARWGLLPGLAFAVLRGTVTALSDAQPVMVIMIGANLLNILGNYVLAFGKGGFPALGLTGLALASTLSHTVMGVTLLSYLVWHHRGRFRPYCLGHQWYRIDLARLRQLLTLGIPIGILTILENGLFTVMTLMMGALGTATLAAQQLALQTVVIAFMLPLGMSYAATARVGQWYGQHHWPGVRRAALVSVSLTTAVMLVAGCLFIALPRPIIGIYLDTHDPLNQEVVQIGVALLTVAGYGQIVDGVQRTANGVLQGLQDTRIPMLLSGVAFWGVGLGTGYWLGFHTPLRGVGIWIGAYLGLAVAAIAYILRFRHLWRHSRRSKPAH